MKSPKVYKNCPECAEDIKIEAVVCRYCGSSVKKKNCNKGGKFVTVKIKAHGKLYTGDIHITEVQSRVSDILNDNRKFISLVNATEQGKIDDLEIGFVALNKSIVESVSITEDQSEKEENPFYSYDTNKELSF